MSLTAEGRDKHNLYYIIFIFCAKLRLNVIDESRLIKFFLRLLLKISIKVSNILFSWDDRFVASVLHQGRSITMTKLLFNIYSHLNSCDLV